MADRAAVAERQEPRPQGIIVGLLTMPFRLFGALLGSLLLSILIEWLGLHFFWPMQSWHHAQGMLRYELDQISTHFRESLLILNPQDLARHWICILQEKLFHNAHLAAWARRMSVHPLFAVPHEEVIRHAVNLAHAQIKPYALAAGYTLLTFLVRL